MTMLDLPGYLFDIYGVEVVAAEFISTVADSVLKEVTAWQNKPLESVYPIVYMDAHMVKAKDNRPYHQ